ncbi:MAG: aminoglycoside N(3)-acetyltransferase [Waterburya sp.]
MIPLTLDYLSQQLKTIGIRKGQTLIVHCSLSKIGWVIGGAEVVIQALIQAVGCDGTLIMPTQTWKNLDPSRGVDNVPESWWSIIREHLPAYNPDTTPSVGMGVVAELFRTFPNAKRSSHPVRSFAALGAKADCLVSEHDLEDVFGNSSPLGKLYDLDGYILLIGVSHSANTSLHLAEHRASYPGKCYVRESSAILVKGKRQWVTYQTLDLQADDFATIGNAYEAAHQIQLYQLGQATVRFIKQRLLIDWAVNWMEQHRK